MSVFDATKRSGNIAKLAIPIKSPDAFYSRGLISSRKGAPPIKCK